MYVSCIYRAQIGQAALRIRYNTIINDIRTQETNADVQFRRTAQTAIQTTSILPFRPALPDTLEECLVELYIQIRALCHRIAL